jgi:hypothetical protein
VRNRGGLVGVIGEMYHSHQEGDGMEDIRQKWEDWYGDLLSAYEWHELEYGDGRVLYVCGNSTYTGGEGSVSSAFIQVMGRVDSDVSLDEEAQGEIAQLLKSRHGIDNICFWMT